MFHFWNSVHRSTIDAEPLRTMRNRREVSAAAAKGMDASTKNAHSPRTFRRRREPSAIAGNDIQPSDKNAPMWRTMRKRCEVSAAFCDFLWPSPILGEGERQQMWYPQWFLKSWR